jgi:hypothetical protein
VPPLISSAIAASALLSTLRCAAERLFPFSLASPVVSLCSLHGMHPN